MTSTLIRPHDTGVDLADDQAYAINAAQRWYRTNPERPFLIYGPAGTGKTTIARQIADLCAPEKTVFVAMTGKAASVLEAKGCPARTVHSAIYSPKGDSPEVRELRRVRAELAAAARPDAAKLIAITAQIKALSGGRFAPKDPTAAFDGTRPRLIVVDEASMVSDQVAADLAALNIPTLVLGDPYQLPPVKGRSGYPSTPDAALTTIHRYAGPLLDMATAARSRRPLAAYSRSTLAGRYGGAYDVALLGRFDQVIVHRNTTRWDIIRGIRAAQGRRPGKPSPGDKIMVIRNDSSQNVVNGQQATVVDAQPVGDGQWMIRTHTDTTWIVDGRGFISAEQQQIAKDDRDSDAIAATFCHAITCHAAQGSEWGSVAVIDESPSAEWLYTAITRAQRECIVLSRRPNRTAVEEGTR